ncbi:chromate efflux transporter [Paenibacillus lemnae]|uniref:Chromate efflux transporter n=2 Tax=Paenibacillus lemnae TaxID=1330551 RepID=A0A848M6E9_PAELE|nr:chromate efflux transporter [Paenibacillus lemnae]NMO96305.1 chromate efflux transporter [Paenibacillus lemnae]
MSNPKQREQLQPMHRRLAEVWWTALKLGLTSFGGPVAHLGYFHNMYVKRKQWLDEKAYAELVALCQFLPGPASSQVGIGIGIQRAGLWGGAAAWLGFTLPSVLLLILFAMFIQGFDSTQIGALQGLKLVAVAIVAQAVMGMAGKLASGTVRAGIALGSMAVVLLWQSIWIQPAVIAVSGLVGYLILKEKTKAEEVKAFAATLSLKSGMICLILFFVLLLGLPVLASSSSLSWISIADEFYRTGSLVFGGGHVVLPLLEAGTVQQGTVSANDFIAGYGAAQAVPGPLFTFAAYLGTLMQGLPGALLAAFFVFLPGFLLVVGILPVWSRIRQYPGLNQALGGVNAAVVGILFAALYDPIWTSTVINSLDLVIAAVLFLMLTVWKIPAWAVVAAGAAAGQLLL